MSGHEKEELKAQYLRAVFDTFPLPAFIVDSDLQIHDFNTAAEPFLGSEPASALYRCSGEALRCLHAEPAGCGKSKECKDCVVRNSVTRAITGETTHREVHRAELRAQTGTRTLDLLVTASLLPYTEQLQALLILEDVTEICTLRRLIPVCPRCKRIRDDRGYWKGVENLIRDSTAIDFTASLCPECARVHHQRRD
jgi:PAS domain-containing protein